jgi:hypothetical protein
MVRRFYCKYKRITYEVGVLMRLDELIQLKRIMEDLEGNSPPRECNFDVVLRECKGESSHVRFLPLLVYHSPK